MSLQSSFTLSILLSISLLIAGIHACFAGTVEKQILKSAALENTLIGISPERNVYVYLPDGYDENKIDYPTIYFISNFEQKIDEQVVNALDEAIAKGDIPPSVFVSADYDLKQGLNFFGNNQVVGRWLDFIHQDLLGWVESRFRVKQGAPHRAISGHFLGGYAALKLAMLYPNTYGSVYALHPVATDTGDIPFLFKPDWNEIHAAKNHSELQKPYSSPFVSMAQAHLPNGNKPPFYADFIVERVAGELQANVANIRKLKQVFHLSDLTPKYAENLTKLRGIGMDWGRNDQNWDHVIGARRYTVLLENFGIQLSAEEHGGNGWDYHFEPKGKIRSRMLPFLGQHLVP